MAEFCKECYVKVCGGSEKDVVTLSDELDLCEGCGEYKHVVVDVWPRRDPIDFSWLTDLFKKKKSRKCPHIKCGHFKKAG